MFSKLPVLDRSHAWFVAGLLALGILGTSLPTRAEPEVDSKASGSLKSVRERRAGDGFLQASTGVGYSTYDQDLDGGYVVNGVGYDVYYSGTTYTLDASGGYFFSQSWGVGAELEYLRMPSPNAVGTPQNGGSTVERDDVEAADFFDGSALLALRPIVPLRLSALVGYGGGSAPSAFGGSGPLLGLSGDYAFAAGERTSVSVGAQAKYFFLSDPEHTVGNATKRAESGPLLTAGLRVSLGLDFFGG